MTDSDNDWNPKRPQVSQEMYVIVRELADRSMAVSSERVDWNTCLELVIKEYVDDRHLNHARQDINEDRETSDGTK